jgi:hypothetical protein
VFTEPLLRNGLLHSNGCTRSFRGLCLTTGIYARIYSILYMNEPTSSSVSDANRDVIIRDLIDSIFKILPVFTCRWEMQTYVRHMM